MTEGGKTTGEARTEHPRLLKTGIPNLDLVLGGGLRLGSVTMVMGSPGAGKTMLAQQIAFQAAGQDSAVLYLTGYSETHDKLLANSRGLSFFDALAIGRVIQFLSLTDLLREGAEETEEAIVSAVLAHHAVLLVLDGFRSIRRFLKSDAEVGHFLYSLGAKLAMLGATTLVCVEGVPQDSSHDPELTVCDAIVALRRELRGTRERRTLEVLKVRGAAPVGGVHPFTITSDGITVFPRLESIVTAGIARWSSERCQFGIPGVDALLAGGLTANTVTLVAGTPGVGKTLLGLHFLSAAEELTQPTLYVGFTEAEAQLRERSRVFGLKLAKAEAAGRLRLAVLPGYDLEADRIASLIAQDVEQRGVRRLMIDSVAGLQRGVVDAQRQVDFLAALVSFLRNHDVTTYVTQDINSIVGTTLELAETPLSVLGENLLVLRYAEYRNRLHRLLAVIKMRFSNYDPKLHEYGITAGRGVELLGPAPPAVGLLTGIAQPLNDDNDPQPRPA
jgi:circadian clock protein KaiC